MIRFPLLTRFNLIPITRFLAPHLFFLAHVMRLNRLQFLSIIIFTESTSSVNITARFKLLMQAQQVQEERFPRASNLYTTVENLVDPMTGLTNSFSLGRLISQRLESVVYEVAGYPHRQNLVVKYQANCHVDEIHPLILDFTLLQLGFDNGISPAPLYLSPPSPMIALQTPKTIFTMSQRARKGCADSRGMVRFMVMERVGRCLADIYAERPPSIPDAFRVARRVTQLVQILHERTGTYHGDIHAGNICFPLGVAETDFNQLILIDFGSGDSKDTESDEIFRPAFSYRHPALTPWQMIGYKFSRRDDVYKAVYTAANLINGETRTRDFISGLTQEQQFHWKLTGAIFRIPGSRAFSLIRDVGGKNVVEGMTTKLMDYFKTLESIDTPIPYTSLIELMTEIINFIEE